MLNSAEHDTVIVSVQPSALLWRRGFTEDVLLHRSSRCPHAPPKASKE